MAILSVKIRILGNLKVIAVALAVASYAAANAAGTGATQATTEVFDVKEKDLPTAAAPAPSKNDIPAPDFKEFEDEKFIDNLLGENGKSPAAPNTKAEPDKALSGAIEPAPVVPVEAPADDKPPVVDDIKPAEIAAPNPETKPDAQDAPAPTAPLEAAKPLETNATAPTDSTATTAETAATSPSPDLLTDEEKALYVELKKHLLSFVEGTTHISTASTVDTVAPVAEKPTNEATQESKPEDAVPPQPAASAPDAPTATPTANASEEKAAPGKTNVIANELAGELASEIDELLEPKKEPTKEPAVTAVDKTATPHAEEKKTEDKAAAPAVTETKPVTPPQIAETKAPALAAKTDTAAEIPAAKTKEFAATEPEEEKPVATKEKPSEADKAYFKLLDKKHDALPEDKKLSSSSKNTIEGISSAIAPVKKSSKKQPEYIKVERGGNSQATIEEDGVIKSQNKMDLSVRKVGKNEDVEKSKVKLEKAYKALLLGQVSAATNLYKDVLEKEPDNKEAMFGLATSYHKNSQFEQARAIYTKLLSKEPDNKEALNNFLVLVAEEAPEDALIELEKLERINSDFSPIPAQIAMINLKLGETEKAARYLRRAILLSPDNVSYKYNLAITYDKLGKQDQAVQLYHQVIESARNGAVIPGSLDKLIERATYLERKITEKK